MNAAVIKPARAAAVSASIECIRGIEQELGVVLDARRGFDPEPRGTMLYSRGFMPPLAVAQS
jgi:hypothetical protein